MRGLAAELNVSKPAITRALDRLGELDLARRKVDPMDRRSVLVQRTLKGSAFLRDLRSIMGDAATAVIKKAPQAASEAASSAHAYPPDVMRSPRPLPGGVRVHPQRGMPEFFARLTTKPSQHSCGGSVSSGTKGSVGVGAARNNSEQMPPKAGKSPVDERDSRRPTKPERCAT